jgi:ABC-type transport system involved in multi-copper enzyme maturation permease subunit
VPEDTVTLFGIVSVLAVVGLVLTFLVSLGFLVGTLLRKPLLAAVVLVFLWYPIGIVLNVFSLEEFSPISLSRAMSTQLRRPWRAPDVDAKGRAAAQDTDALTRQLDHFFSVFSTAQAKPAATRPEFFEGGSFNDFSLLRVTLGYGLPTLLAVVLAMLFFHWRDL